MKLGTKGRYAVMSMVDLACHVKDSENRENAVILNDISLRTEISLPYLEQIFMKLRKNGLVKSFRGPGGGYRLARPACSIRISDILLAVDEGLQATRCDKTSPMGCRQDKGRCLTHDLWEALGHQMNLFLNSVSLEDVIEKRLFESRFYEQLHLDEIKRVS